MQVIVESLSPAQAAERGVFSWPESERGVSRYTWHYDATEVCYLVRGLARIETEDGNVEVEAGDFLTLPAGLECVWDIREPLMKRYTVRADDQDAS